MMKNILLILVVALLASPSIKAADGADFFEKSDRFFKQYVRNGKVDYKAVKANSSSLDAALSAAQDLEIPKSNAAEFQAFWINAYNLLVVKGIIDNYPVKTPLDIPGFFDKTKRNVGGTSITLNDIENKMLRKNFPKEARFHFALVCAGLGCPPIINEVYHPQTLDKQLQRQTVKSLNNDRFIRVEGKKVLISQIFEWYKEDFVQGGQTEVEYINKFRKEKLDTSAKLGYYKYNWSLNEVK